MKRRICDIAEEVLKETNNPAVMWGDSGLIDLIADKAGVWLDNEHPFKRWKRIFNSLSKQPGNLIKGKSRSGNQIVRKFSLQNV